MIPDLPKGYQHRRAVEALAAVEIMMQALNPESAWMKQQKDKIVRWKEECRQDTKVRRLSAGAERDIRRWADEFCRVSGVQQDGFGLSGWRACMYAAYTFLVDAIATCPTYTTSRRWKYLLQTVETLVERLEEEDPACAEKGTEIYMQSFIE